MVLETIANHHVSMIAGIKRKALVPVYWCFCAVKDVCYRAALRTYLTTLFVQPRDWSENQSPFKDINCEDAAERAFLLLPIGSIDQCSCMWVLGPACECWGLCQVCARCQHERQAWKEESWLHRFDGLNSLKMALLSKILNRSKSSILCLFRY